MAVKLLMIRMHGLAADKQQFIVISFKICMPKMNLQSEY
ncbi:hypothetical protein CEM_142 [Candidatus Johnevansia muelleri]|uniref:Uncharacterized protein n=1 Tax=Candidatus Johnevansia muelleri TaxID=1495769 RepID=A0A078KHL2_9GAMM|nr:hypothetical protein CEM_142 [Candidatus Evansia muelleri]